MSRLEDLALDNLQEHPDNVAVVFDDQESKQSLTYKELHIFIQRTSDELKARKISNEYVGVLYTPCVDLPAIIIGILKSNSAFVCLDYRTGHELLRKTTMTVGIKYIITEKHIFEKIHLPRTLICEISLIKDYGLFCVNEDQGKPGINTVDEETAYVMSTSGTTGFPKLVYVPHSCIVPNIVDLSARFSITKRDTVFLASPMTFDPSIVEMFLALSNGATLLITPNHIKVDPSMLMNILSMNNVTVLQVTPTLFSRFSRHLIKSSLLSKDSSLRVLAFGGERCPTTNTFNMLRMPGNKTQFYNLYGITEVSCWASCHHITELELRGDEKEISLGEVLQGTEWKVVDAKGTTCISGRLLVGGVKRNCIVYDGDIQPAMDQYYRDTGDIVSVNDGVITFVGRGDNQIKRHGKRLNLLEISQVLRKVCMLSWTHAVYERDKIYVFVASRQPPDTVQNIVNKTIHEHLPSHYQPDFISVMDKLPFTKHGKLDTTKLLSQVTPNGQGKVKHTMSTYSVVEQVIKDLLMVNVVEQTKRFVDYGGTSLTAVQFVDNIERRMGRIIPLLLDVVLARTIGEVVKCIEQAVFHKASLDKNSTITKSEQSEEKENSKMHVKGSKRIKISIQHIYLKSVQRGSRLTYIPTEGVPENVEYCYKHHGQQCQTDINIKVKWKYNTGKCVDASPVIVIDDRIGPVVYMGSHSKLFLAISLLTGDVLWQQKLGDRIESSACVSGDGCAILVGCYDSHMYVLDRHTGEIRWMYKTSDVIKSSPCVDPCTSLVYFGSHDQHLHAVDIEDQKEVWKVCLDGSSIFSSPIVSNIPHNIYVATLKGNLFAVEPENGTLKWSYNCEKPIFTSPALSQHGVCIASVSGVVYLLDHSGHLMWTYAAKNTIFSSPVACSLSNEKVYIIIGCHDEYIHCISLSTGCSVWQCHLGASCYSTSFIHTYKRRCVDKNREPSSEEHTINSQDCSIQGKYNESAMQKNIDDDVETVLDADHTDDNSGETTTIVAACSTQGTVFILCPCDGSILTQLRLPGDIFSSPVLFGRHLVLGCRDNNIYCLELS